MLIAHRRLRSTRSICTSKILCLTFLYRLFCLRMWDGAAMPDVAPVEYTVSFQFKLEHNIRFRPYKPFEIGMKSIGTMNIHITCCGITKDAKGPTHTASLRWAKTLEMTLIRQEGSSLSFRFPWVILCWGEGYISLLYKHRGSLRECDRFTTERRINLPLSPSIEKQSRATCAMLHCCSLSFRIC